MCTAWTVTPHVANVYRYFLHRTPPRGVSQAVIRGCDDTYTLIVHSLVHTLHDVARKMLEKGAKLNFSVETTGLTAAQVAALQNGKKK